MAFSSSSSKKEVTQQYDNRAFQLGEGPAVIADNNTGNITLKYTDHGAILAARDISRRALDLGEESLDRALDFGGDSLKFGNKSLDFAQDVSQELSSGYRAALAEVAGAGRDAAAKIDEANRSDTARSFEALIKWGAGAVAAAVVLPPLIRSMK